MHSLDQASSINSTGVYKIGYFSEVTDQEFKVCLVSSGLGLSSNVLDKDYINQQL